MIQTDDGCRLWVADERHGTPVVMCHGGPGLWDMTASLVPLLTGQLRVIRWDQRGSGRSERRGPYWVARSVADLDAVRGQLGLDRMVVCGHSWGASLGLRYALDHPDRVSALIYVSGVGLGWSWYEPFKEASPQRQGEHRPRILELRARERTEAESRELAVLEWSAEFTDGDALARAREMATPWFGISYECNAVINAELKQTWHEDDLIAECRELTVPVLIIDGPNDSRPRWAVDSLEQALPAVQRVTLPGRGHIPWLEDGNEFASVLLDYLVPGHRPA
jgi:proline iminopeptidase